MSRYTLNSEGQVVPLPEIPEEQPMETIEEEQPKHRPWKHDISDLTEVPQQDDHDMYTDDLLKLTDRDIYGGDPDMSDLLSVSNDEIMNGSRARKPTKRFRRTAKNYPAPPTLGGVNY